MLFYLIYEVLLKKFNISFPSNLIEKCNEKSNNENINIEDDKKEYTNYLYTIHEENFYKIV
jgi:hypothetical protein